MTRVHFAACASLPHKADLTTCQTPNTQGCSDQLCAGVTMSRRPAGDAAWRREDWPSCQTARHRLRAFWTSPHHFEFNTWGPVLSVRIPSVRRLDRRPVCHRRRPCGLRTDRTSDACAELIRASPTICHRAEYARELRLHENVQTEETNRNDARAAPAITTLRHDLRRHRSWIGLPNWQGTRRRARSDIGSLTNGYARPLYLLVPLRVSLIKSRRSWSLSSSASPTAQPWEANALAATA